VRQSTLRTTFTGLVRNCNKHTLGNPTSTHQTRRTKVARNTYSTLVIEKRPILVSAVLGFFFFASSAGAIRALMAGEWVAGIVLSVSAVFSALLIRLIVRRVQVIFDRNGDTITFRARNMRGYNQVIHALGDLSHAKKDGHDTARSVLMFDRGMSQREHPITQYHVSGPAPKRSTDAINAWLKAPAPVDSEPPKA